MDKAADRRLEGLALDRHDANGEMLRRFLDQPEFATMFTAWARGEAFRRSAGGLRTLRFTRGRPSIRNLLIRSPGQSVYGHTGSFVVAGHGSVVVSDGVAGPLACLSAWLSVDASPTGGLGRPPGRTC